jgi:hypothetical protein
LADGSKVPGVLVTITGDLIGKKTTISTDQGNFRFLALPPGAYDLKLELEGFKTQIRKGVEVSLGKTASLNILMETSTLKEEVTVIGKVGAIDMRKTTVGVNVDSKTVASIPTARNPWTVLSTIAGIMLDRVDVGGADSGQQSNFLAGGGNTDDTTWNVDGANITDPSAIGAAPAYLNINAYQEVQVTLGANDISAQTGGVQLNYVTKRAGNKHAGDFHLYVEDKAWEMKQTRTPYQVSRGIVIPGVNRLYQYGVGLGGPIITDKLWWYGSWAIQDIVKRTESGATDSTWLVSGYAKLNFQLGNTSGDFHLSHDAKKKWGRTILSPSQQNDGSLWDQDGPGYIIYGGLSHVFGELMLNAKAVKTLGGFTLDPRGANINPATGHNEGGDWKFVDGGARYEDGLYHYKTDRTSLDVSMDGNYFLEGFIGGDHEIKFGVDYFTADTTSYTLYPNQRIVYIYRETPEYNYLGIYPDHYSDVNFYRISGYVQDTMTFGKLTAAIGLRYDKEQGGLNHFTEPYFTYYEPGNPHNGERMYANYIGELDIKAYKVPANWSLISPRLSLTYDITGDGKNVLKLSVGRYMSQSGNQMANTYVPGRYGYAYWTDLNGDEKVQYNEVGELSKTDRFTNLDPITGMKVTKYEDGYNTPMLDELTLTYERALMEDLSISLTGFYKKRHNLTDDVSSKGEQAFNSKGIMPNGSIETAANWVRVATRSLADNPLQPGTRLYYLSAIIITTIRRAITGTSAVLSRLTKSCPTSGWPTFRLHIRIGNDILIRAMS